MEKQAIWKIPVIFELFPKTPTGATVRPAHVQPRAGPSAVQQASQPGRLPPCCSCLAHRGVRLESPVRVQPLLPGSGRPAARASLYVDHDSS